MGVSGEEGDGLGALLQKQLVGRGRQACRSQEIKDVPEPQTTEGQEKREIRHKEIATRTVLNYTHWQQFQHRSDKPHFLQFYSNVEENTFGKHLAFNGQVSSLLK